MDETTNLLLPYILAAQAQKHVTHNEALRKLDALVQISVVDRDLSAPPATPAEGARYIIAASPTGEWGGHSGKLAAWQDGAWAIFTPRKGWLAWIEDEGATVAWNGAAWVAANGGVNPTPLVGVNATADSTNRLAVASPASLFNHGGAGHQIKINKNAPGDTASILFQTGFSGRAEMGTAGNDDYAFKVSPDGSSWFNAILINRTSGAVTFPNSSIGGGLTDGDKGDVVVSGTGAVWTVDLNVVGNTKLADMAALTVKGNATNALADPSDIAASVDGHVLRRSGTTLGFGTIASAGISDAAVTNAKLANAAALTVKGNAANAASVPADIAASVDGQVLRRSGTTLGFGTLATAGLTDDAVSNAKLANMAALTLKGNNTAALADPADLTVAQVKSLLALAAADVTGVQAQGKQTIALPAGAMVPRATNGAALATIELATNDIMLRTLDFDQTIEEGVGFFVPMPKSWNEGTVSFQPIWTAATGTGGVVWQLDAFAFSDDDALDQAVGGAVVSTDALIAANDCHIGPESAALTISGVPIEGDLVYFQITRRVADVADTLTADAKLIGIRLFFTTNAGNDA